VHQLKGVIQERYRRTAEQLAVTLLSFGFKHGLPAEADIVLDVRFLPQPLLRGITFGVDGRRCGGFTAFVLDNADANEFLDRAVALLTFMLPRAEREGKSVSHHCRRLHGWPVIDRLRWFKNWRDACPPSIRSLYVTRDL